MSKDISARNASLTSQESSYSAIIIADMVAEVQQQSGCKPHKEEDKKEPADSNGISKGVILNALQFGQNEKRMHEKSFKDMSALRKMVFGFSFLPSLMFVLCFAFIFPCEKILPCVDLKWSLDLNDTEITSNLLVPKNVLFTFSKKGGYGLKSLNELSGDILWENNLTSSSTFFKCGKFADTDKESCLLMDNIGTMHLFDPSDGQKIWEKKLNISNFSVTVLPDCNEDGLDEIAVATSESQIRILSMRNIFIKGCDSIPVNLIAWKKRNETDLIFICQEGENEKLMKISQEEWCRNDNNEIAKMSILTTEKAGILSQSKFLSITEGLILWKLDFVTMFKNDGQQKWSVPCSNHSTKNRFLMNGNLKMDKKEIFLYSSDISSTFQVTWLSAENGKMIQTKTIPHLELTEAVLIHGEEFDFIIGLKKKISESKAISYIKEISASVLNILTNKDVVSIPTRITEEIILMEMDGNDLKTIQSKTLDYAKSESNATSFTVVLNDDRVGLFVTTQIAEKSIRIKSITLSNWGVEKTSHCVWKYL